MGRIGNIITKAHLQVHECALKGDCNGGFEYVQGQTQCALFITMSDVFC